jgi:hypothetical protein
MPLANDDTELSSCDSERSSDIAWLICLPVRGVHVGQVEGTRTRVRMETNHTTPHTAHEHTPQAHHAVQSAAVASVKTQSPTQRCVPTERLERIARMMCR